MMTAGRIMPDVCQIPVKRNEEPRFANRMAEHDGVFESRDTLLLHRSHVVA